MIEPATTDEVFVYGTLLPGEQRWPHLATYVVGDGVADRVEGDLFDTGCGYPAAIFAGDPRYSGGSINGRRFTLIDTDVALEVLDEVEGVVGGAYHRVQVRTASGAVVWAYQYGDGLDLRPIAGGDWLTRNDVDV